MPRFERVQESPGQVPSASPDAFGSGQGSAAVAGALGQVAQVSEQIADAAAKQRTSVAIARAGSEIAEASLTISQTPDFETYEERFEADRKRIIEKHRKALGGIRGAFSAAYEASVSQASNREILSLRSTARKRQIDQAKADLDEAAQLRIQEAASAESDVDRQRILNEQTAAEDLALGSGLITAQEHGKRTRGFRQAVLQNQIAQDTLDDPGGTFLILRDPDQAARVYPGLEEAERQKYALKSIKRYEALERLQIAQDRLAISQGKEAQRQLAITTEREMILQATPGIGDGISLAEVYAVSDRVSASTLEDLQEIALSGGFIRPAGGRNSQTYLDLSAKAARGHDIEAEANEAYRKQQITQGDRDSLLDIRADATITPAREFLDDALNAGLTPTWARAQRRADGLAEFNEWVHAKRLANEPISRADAMQQARDIRDRAQSFIATRELEILPPPGAVWEAGSEGRRLDPGATQQAILDRFAERYGFPRGTPLPALPGSIRFQLESDAEFTFAMAQFDDFMQAQAATDSRKALPQAGAP